MPIAAYDLLNDAESMMPPPQEDRCAVKGCVFPWRTDQLCYQHLHFFDFKESMTDTTLDPSDIWDEENPFRPVLCVLSKEELQKDEPTVKVVWAGWKPSETQVSRPADGNYWRVALAQAEAHPVSLIGKDRVVRERLANMQIGRGVGSKGFGRRRNLKCSQRTKRKEKLKNKVGGRHGAHDDTMRWNREAALITGKADFQGLVAVTAHAPSGEHG